MSLHPVLLWWCLVVLGLVGGAQAFLPTQLNMSDPDVTNILCPSELDGEIRDHQWITREGIRRNIHDFFLTHPPAGNPDFYLPDDASLTELFHAYYGPTASSTRFIKAVNSVATANVMTDSAQAYRYDPAIHSDGEQLDAVQEKLVARYPQIISTIMVDEAYSASRSLLGTSLHSIQKFYSHSTWVEQDNVDILEALGDPGMSLDGMLAGDTEDVCTSCPSSQGSCSGNVILGAGLSSGYYTYPTEIGESQLIPKPTTGGKCSHGGSLDLSSRDEAIGGVNKDTTSPCFSPHHHLHSEAAELAVSATDYYLGLILTAVGPDKYRKLFDLYQGSALSISIDTTGSMGDDIDAVKDQVTQIVANTPTEVYVLSEFNDPGCGPVLKTSDPDEFLDAVLSLSPSGGLGDGPELFWCGLQNALGETPEYGDVFCFTDNLGKDGELMDGVISLAQRQHNKVTVILSDLLDRKIQRVKSDVEERDEEEENITGKRGSRDILTDIDDYQRLADATGGLLISAAKFDIDDITNIIGSSVETSTVTALQLETSEDLGVEVAVDDSVVDCELRISGQITSALFTDPTGTIYDIMDKAGLEATAGVEVITHTETLKAVHWTAPNIGMWLLNTTLASSSHSVTLLATSTLDFLNAFAFLDPSPPHPHYRPIEGQPLINTVYYLEITLVGHLESNVAVISGIQFVDKAGVVLREVEYPFDAQDQVYVRTDPLPEQPFYVRLVGYLRSGNLWMRYSGVEVWPVETRVDLFATSEELSAYPGESVSALFFVTNYGIESFFTITGIDDLHFLTAMVPDRVFLGTNDTMEVEAQFTVPIDAKHGHVSTIIITARSELQTQSVNSALAHFIVLSPVVDLGLPTCALTNTPDCTGFLTNGVCLGQNWTANAIFQDSVSGLYDVRSEPESLELVVTGLTPGTTLEVMGDFLHSCCNPQASLRAVDGMGNVGECSVDMGILGGMIENFHVEQEGDRWMIVKWSITPSDIPIHHYNLIINSNITQQSACPESTCTELVNYLVPCTIHQFVLTPVFTGVGGDQLTGAAAYTQGTTQEGGDPQPPTNGKGVDATETSITVSWEPPNLICTYTYEVCHYEVNTDPGLALCGNTTLPSYTIRDLEECKAYFIDVVTHSNDLASSPLNFYSVTICTGIP